MRASDGQRPLPTWLFRLLPFLLLGIVAGCSSSDGNPTDPGDDPRAECPFSEPPANFPNRNATFQTAAPPGPNSVFLRASTLGNCPDLLLLDIVANGVTDVSGIRYNLSWPANFLTFDASRLGPFLGTGVTMTGSGTQAELRRPPNQAGVDGSGVITTIAWAYQGPTGNVPFTFIGELFDDEGDVIPGTQFISGTATITPP